MNKNDSSHLPAHESLQHLIKIRKKFIKNISPFFEFFYRYYFRCQVKGWENVPDGKVLFVGNHNGMITFEVLMFFHAWWKRFGKTRTALGLAHGFMLNHVLFKWVMPKIGAIPADPVIAQEAFDAGYSLCVYPGGKKECYRPFYLRKKIDFFQRKGFIKLALSSHVPIVPIVSIGAHESYIILSRGEWLAELLGVKKKWKVPGLPITFRMIFSFTLMILWFFMNFSFLWILLSWLITFIPFPVQMTFQVLPAIDPSQLMDSKSSEAENLQFIYNEVHRVMQKTMLEGYAKKKTSLFR